jgi:hypothetical protein
MEPFNEQTELQVQNIKFVRMSELYQKHGLDLDPFIVKVPRWLNYPPFIHPGDILEQLDPEELPSVADELAKSQDKFKHAVESEPVFRDGDVYLLVDCCRDPSSQTEQSS